MKRAVCLLSGGLDSTTAAYQIRKDGFEIIALTIHYGQIHSKEIESAKMIAAELKAPHEILKMSLPWGGSALLDKSIPIPTNRTQDEMIRSVPVTYVPARNTIFLSYAMSFAEVSKADAIVIGANVLDYSGYPDCRPEYLQAFEEVIRLGTKAGDEGAEIKILAPLLHMNKKEIVELAAGLGVPFEKTWSCYQGGESPCGECDSCQLRIKGFDRAGIKDPLMKGMKWPVSI